MASGRRVLILGLLVGAGKIAFGRAKVKEIEEVSMIRSRDGFRF